MTQLMELFMFDVRDLDDKREAALNSYFIVISLNTVAPNLSIAWLTLICFVSPALV